MTYNLNFVLEQPRGSYKEFAKSLDEYPILGVTYPTDYGFIEGHTAEDGKELDLFLGRGKQYARLEVFRSDCPDGYETKFIALATHDEIKAIRSAFKPVVKSLHYFDSRNEFYEDVSRFKNP